MRRPFWMLSAAPCILLLLLLPVVACSSSSEKSLRSACAAGDPGACDVLSARFAYGDGVAKNPALADEFGARAMELCARADAGASPSCTRLSSTRIGTSVPLDLPRAATGGEVQTVMSITLAADGTTSINGKAVANDDAILSAARDAREKNPEIRAVIKADSTIPHGRVIHVLDLLKQAQVAKIAFGVTPAEPAPPIPIPAPIRKP